jgi:predicted Zn-dependent protease
MKLASLVLHRFGFLAKIACFTVLFGATGAVCAQNCQPPEDLRPEQGQKPTTEQMNKIASWFAEHEQYGCAADVFAASLQSDPNQSDGRHIVFMFGAALYLSGDAKEAIPVLQQAESLGHRDQRLNLMLAQALDAQHATADAEDEWRKALAFDPESASILEALSDDLLSENKFAEVIAAVDVRRLVPFRTPHLALNLAAAYEKTQKLDAAERVLRDAYNSNPDSMEIANELASVLTQLNRKAEADLVLKLAHVRQEQTAK